MRGALGSFPIDWNRISAKITFSRETTRPRTEPYTADHSAPDRGASPTNAFDVPGRLPELGALGPDGGIMNRGRRRFLATHSTETTQSTSTCATCRERRQARFASQNNYLVSVCLFVIVLFVGTCYGREKMQSERRRELDQEFKDNSSTRPLSDAAVFNIHDLSPSSLSHFTRPTKIPKTTKVQKKSKGISEERKAENTRNAACKKLVHFEPDTDELLKAADAHTDLMESYCGTDKHMVPGCHPVPVVLHIGRMCVSSPADISNYSQLKTVVALCPAIPCCDAALACRAKASVEFNQTFKIVVWPSTTKIVTLPLRNDTACECGKIGKTKCPKASKPVEDKSRCECPCHHHKSKDCEAIKDGRRSLNDAERRCVTERKCPEPICSVDRHYNTTAGFCESSSRAAEHK